MILQCEQCHTRFRLDDSKLKPGGVKVRCSKCRHVFIAGAETPQEETDFDAILSGLGAPAPTPEPSAPAEPPAPAESPAPAAEAAPPAHPEPEPEEEEAEAPAPVAAAPGEPAEFSFDVLHKGAEEEPAPAAPAFAGVSEFSFEPEPAEPAAPAPASAPVLGPAEFSFEPEAPALAVTPPPTEDMAGFNEFSFEEEPSAKELEPPPSGTEVAGFQEFSFDEEPAAPGVAEPEKPKGAPREFDFGEFSFEPEPEPEVKEPEMPAGASDFDFGDFAFDAGAEEEEEKKVREFDLSDFTFEGDADTAARELAENYQPEPETEPEPEVAGFALGVEDATHVTSATEEGAEAAGIEGTKAEETRFSFNDDLLGSGSAAPVAAPVAAPEEAPEAAAADEEPAASVGEGAKGIPLASLLDFDKVFADSHGATGAGFEEEEDVPPLGISSRRKGRPVVTASLAVLALLLIAVLAAAGFYLTKGGPATLDRVGLGFVAQWFGLEGAEEGRIAIVNPLAAFYQNKEVGELFVVSGQAENQFRKPRASIHVRVSIFDKGGKVLMQKTAYCGNKLSEQQLTTLPMAKLDAVMNNQFGDSLSNLGVKPGEKIPFVVAIPNVPAEAADFGVEVIGSTVASQ